MGHVGRVTRLAESLDEIGGGLGIVLDDQDTHAGRTFSAGSGGRAVGIYVRHHHAGAAGAGDRGVRG